MQLCHVFNFENKRRQTQWVIIVIILYCVQIGILGSVYFLVCFYCFTYFCLSPLLKVYNKVQKTKLGACWVQSLESRVTAQHVYPVNTKIKCMKTQWMMIWVASAIIGHFLVNSNVGSVAHDETLVINQLSCYAGIIFKKCVLKHRGEWYLLRCSWEVFHPLHWVRIPKVYVKVLYS